jgi:hypothetical protein
MVSRGTSGSAAAKIANDLPSIPGCGQLDPSTLTLAICYGTVAQSATSSASCSNVCKSQQQAWFGHRGNVPSGANYGYRLPQLACLLIENADTGQSSVCDSLGPSHRSGIFNSSLHANRPQPRDRDRASLTLLMYRRFRPTSRLSATAYRSFRLAPPCRTDTRPLRLLQKSSE